MEIKNNECYLNQQELDALGILGSNVYPVDYMRERLPASILDMEFELSCALSKDSRAELIERLAVANYIDDLLMYAELHRL